MSVAPAQLALWQSAVGRTETRRQRLEAESLRRFALALGGDPAVEAAMPPLGHWAFFLPQQVDADLRLDGSTKRDGFLPDIALPRRMFAGADIRFEAPLLVADHAEMLSEVVQVSHKAGTSGDLIFVEVDRVITQLGVVRVRERRTYVYRGVSTPPPAPVPVEGWPQIPPGGEVWYPDEVGLARFSAATFNSHRIHYDLPYARDVEGYPALVVHGPLTAAKLAGFAARKGVLSRFGFRARSPLFLGQPILLRSDGDGVSALRCDGAIAMTAKVEYQ